MFEPSVKKVMLLALSAGFVLQSGLVYTDEVDIQLSDEAVEGRKLYHRNACQVCHQLWGQGGFLGPDLTNAGSRVDPTRLSSLLTVGSGQMPPMHMATHEIAAIRSFLTEIDRPDIGRGQLRLGDATAGTTPQAAFEASMVAAAPPASAAAGFETFRSGICSACHFPFQLSTVKAPDLSTVVERLDEAAIREVLTNGRPEQGMPPPAPAFSASDIEQVIAYFGWLHDNRAELLDDSEARQARRSVDWSRLPWWEFR
jgi:nitric oxide reductase subunit C